MSNDVFFAMFFVVAVVAMAAVGVLDARDRKD